MKLQALRLKHGLSQATLAEMADISGKAVSRIECGRVRPKPATARALANALGVHTSDIDEAWDSMEDDMTATNRKQ